MMALVTGGAASGKSVFAERLACSLSTQRTYLATMSRDGAGAQERIAKHRAQRRDGHFTTIECAGSLVLDEARRADAKGVALLDDVGNLVSCALFPPTGAKAEASDVLARLDREFSSLAEQFAHVVVVGNSVGAAGETFSDFSGEWARLVGSLCCCMAARCDCVVEVTAGMPLVVKGRLPDGGQL